MLFRSHEGVASLVTDEVLAKKISRLKYPGEERASEVRIVLQVKLTNKYKSSSILYYKNLCELLAPVIILVFFIIISNYAFAVQTNMMITSQAFKNNEFIPKKFTVMKKHLGGFNSNYMNNSCNSSLVSLKPIFNFCYSYRKRDEISLLCLCGI